MLRWSGQTEIETVAIDEAIISSIGIRSINGQLSNDDKVFITPFEVEEIAYKHRVLETTVIKKTPDILVQAPPACPKCNSKMVQRVAKKGTRQGQMFYGCLQFPKCRGVVNV